MQGREGTPARALSAEIDGSRGGSRTRLRWAGCPIRHGGWPHDLLPALLTWRAGVGRVRSSAGLWTWVPRLRCGRRSPVTPYGVTVAGNEGEDCVVHGDTSPEKKKRLGK